MQDFTVLKQIIWFKFDKNDREKLQKNTITLY